MRKDEIVALALFSDDGQMLDYSRTFTPRMMEIAPLEYRTMEFEGMWLKNWWKERSVPLTRDQIKIFLDKNGYSKPAEYLIKNLGLSLTDYYWIKEPDSNLNWSKVNLFENNFHEDILISDTNNSQNPISYSPNSSLQGDIEKTWTIINGERYLIKGNRSPLSSESINEVIASEIHRLQGYDNYIPYQLIKIKGKAYDYGCMSKMFTSTEKELVSAWAVCTSQSRDNNISYYEHFIKVCGEYGIDTKQLRSDLEYQIMTDFVMSGYDRHLNNVSVLRDSKTLKFIRMAPIYDSGAAFYANRPFPANIREMEKMKVTSFASSEHKLLKYVQNPKVIDIDKLPKGEYIKQMYMKDSKISEKLVDKIVEFYERKIDMVAEMQQGKDPFHRRKVAIY